MTARERSNNFLKGILGKDIVKFMLERSGYTVCSCSYEDNLLDAISKRNSQTSNSNTGRRLRRSPDLIVYDDKNIMLVEVKTRGREGKEKKNGFTFKLTCSVSRLLLSRVIIISVY